MGSKGSDAVVIGYRYRLGVHYIFCQNGVTNVRKIKVGKHDAWTGNVTSSQEITINKPSFFGGNPPEGQGGFNATIEMQFGEATQAPSPYVKNTLHGGNSRVPAYRGRFGMVFRAGPHILYNYFTDEALSFVPQAGAEWGTTGSIPTIAALLTGDGDEDGEVDWYAAKKWVPVSGADYSEMNPVHMLYYWLKSSRNGLGLSASEIDGDETSSTFKDAADACYDEGMGFSFLFGGDNTVQEYIKEILNHADGSVFQDPADGLFKVGLARDDYDTGTLITLDDSNSETLDIHDTAFDELVNHLIIEYYDTSNNTISHVDIHDIGLREAMGGHTVTKRIRYNGCNSKELAQKMGQRDFLALSRPLKRVKIAANREALELKPSDVFLWTNTDEGVEDLVLRVRAVKRGGLKDRKIELDCIQDVFAYGTEVYNVSNPEEWEDPAAQVPTDLSSVELIEAPYWYYWYKFNGLPDEAEAGDGAVLILAARENTSDQNYDVLEKLNTESIYGRFPIVGDFCPSGYLDSSGITFDMISSGQVVVTLQEYSDLYNVRIGSAALIDNEIFRVDDVDADTGEVTLGVGCVDTVASEHAANSTVYFFGYQGGYVADDYIDGNTVDVKLLPRTPYEILDEGDATAHNITLDERADKPYPPAKLRFNGDAYPTAIMGILTVSWAHRDRVLQGAEMYDEGQASIGPESGTNYEVRGYNESGVESWAPDTPATSETWDYEDDDSANADGLYNNSLRIKVWSTRDGLSSNQEHDFTVDRADYGYNYGKYYGGYEA